MKSISFKNFRRFTDFPEFKFGDITILVGGNNAGKSTLVKALDFVVTNLKGMTETYMPVIFNRPFFVVPESLGEYARVHNRNVEDPISIDIKLGKCRFFTEVDRFCLHFELESAKDSDRFVRVNKLCINDMELGIQMTVTPSDTLIEWIEYDQTFEISESTTAYLNFSKIKSLDQMISSIYDAMKSAEKENYYDCAVIKGNYSKTFYELSYLRAERIAEIMTEAAPVIKSRTYNYSPFADNPSSAIHDTSFVITNAMMIFAASWDQAIPDKPGKILLPDSVRARFMESAYALEEQIKELDVTILPMHTPEKCVVYLKEHSLYDLIQKYQDIEDSFVGAFYGCGKKQGIIKMLKQMSLADDFRINSIGGVAFTVELRNLDGNWVHLMDMGSGTIRLFELFLFLEVNKGCHCLFIEEPEVNLHPKLQSRLADIFKEYVSAGGQIILETHSEYLIRRTQVLVSGMALKEDELEKKNPFKVYYFPEDGVPYDMGYQPNGHFRESFGEGFFDEAGRSTRELMRNKRR